MTATCNHCQKTFKTFGGCRTHVLNTDACRAARQEINRARHAAGLGQIFNITEGEVKPQMPAALAALPATHPLRRLWSKAHGV